MPANSKLGHDNRKQLVNAVAVAVAIRQNLMMSAQERSNFFIKYPPKNVPPPPVGIVIRPIIKADHTGKNAAKPAIIIPSEAPAKFKKKNVGFFKSTAVAEGNSFNFITKEIRLVAIITMKKSYFFVFIFAIAIIVNRSSNYTVLATETVTSATEETTTLTEEDVTTSASETEGETDKSLNLNDEEGETKKPLNLDDDIASAEEDFTFTYVKPVPAILDSAPYIVAIEHNNGFCEGAIIAPNWILSTAYCLNDGELKIYAGIHWLRNEKYAEIRLINVTDVIKHPDYKTEKQSGPYNIGLVYVKERFRFTTAVNKIDLSRYEYKRKGVIYTWGNVEELTTLNVVVLSNTECKQFWKTNLHDENICTHEDNSFDSTCGGNTGSPLIYPHPNRPKLLGVLSFVSRNCNETLLPVVYTSVYHYRNWIKNTMKTKH
uniref:Peptidase S1 domain-containing protein n=1 Tax=Glossina brevipalpis TaxID=37001 RepID=A0A1A9WM47_9MUSC